MIEIFPLPVVTATADQAEYCEEETILLSVNSGTSYTWSGPAGFTSNLQSPYLINSTIAQLGIYTIQISDDNGCTNQGQVTILVISSPTVTILGDLLICEGSFAICFSVLGCSGITIFICWAISIKAANKFSRRCVLSVLKSRCSVASTYWFSFRAYC